MRKLVLLLMLGLTLFTGIHTLFGAITAPVYTTGSVTSTNITFTITTLAPGAGAGLQVDSV